MIYIHHNLGEHPKHNIGMLLPVGIFLHQEVQNAKPGDIIKTADDKSATILAIQELSMHTSVADAISMQLYNRHIRYVAAMMHENWGDEMDENIVLYVVVKPNDNEAEIQNRRKV